jgi:hypothetical protein
MLKRAALAKNLFANRILVGLINSSVR